MLWINNTVARSQRALRAVRGAAREGLLNGLIHSRFPAWRREQLEKEWMERLGRDGARPAGCVLVATQVAEQSVDIDADLLITDLAPTDMLIQRMGRLWRHEREGRPTRGPEAWIVGQDLDEADTPDALRELLGLARFVYAPYVLWKTHAVWSGREHVRLPDEVRALLETTYAEPEASEPAWTAELYQEMDERRKTLQQKAAALSGGGLPVLDDREEVATRYSDREMVDVLLLRACDTTGDRASLTLVDGSEVAVNRWQHDWAAARAVHRNLVHLPRYPDFREAKRPAWLEKVIHAPHVAVLRVTETGELVTLDGTPTRYAYDDQRGVQRMDQTPEADWRDRIEEDEFDGPDW